MESSQLSWVLEKPGGVLSKLKSLYNETGSRRRRNHHKSRKGCLLCKQRRVKCNETRPACGPCIEKQWSCEYPDVEPPRKEVASVDACLAQTVTPPQSGSDDAESPAKIPRGWVHAQVLAFLDQANMPSRQSCDMTAYQRQDAIELVDHFIDYREMWIGSPTSQGIIQEHCFPMALEAPYLLHAMLACSAKHLSFLHPNVNKYDTAATLHYTRSLQAYSSQLVHDIECGNGSAMVAASGLLAKLTFIDCTMSSGRSLAAQMAWIRSMQGIRTILSTPRLYHQLSQGFMLPILQRYRMQHTDAELQMHCADPESGAGTLMLLKEQCNSQDPAGTPDPYTAIIARLAPLMLITPSHDMVDQFMAFIATLEPSFIELLEEHETKALLILAMWCATLLRIDQWWTGPPARTECRRICAHLCKIEDPMVRALLQFPASSCGFVLPDAHAALAAGS